MGREIAHVIDAVIVSLAGAEMDNERREAFVGDLLRLKRGLFYKEPGMAWDLFIEVLQENTSAEDQKEQWAKDVRDIVAGE